MKTSALGRRDALKLAAGAVVAAVATGCRREAAVGVVPAAAGSYVVALPMKIEGGSGGPLRIVAFLPLGGTAPAEIQ